MSEKKCKKCSLIKPLSEFYADRRTKDGRATRCRPCLYSKVKNPKPPGRAKLSEKKCPRCLETKPRIDFYECKKDGISWLCRQCTLMYHKNEGHESLLRAAKKFRESAAGGEYRRAYMRQFGAKYRAKYTAEGKIKARYMARYYLDKKPCQVCGSTEVQAHHHDYSKPFDVSWLCSKHHSETHHGFAPVD